MAARLVAVHGDITRCAVDAIVNAANSALLVGGGVDGAIHAAGGPDIHEECRAVIARQGHVPTGAAVLTTAGRLPARRVIHAVGPVWSGRDPERDDADLASCYRSSLRLADDHGLRSVAFPAISTGIFGFPSDRAAGVAVRTVRDVVDELHAVELVVFVCFSPDDLERYRALGLPEVPLPTADAIS